MYQPTYKLGNGFGIQEIRGMTLAILAYATFATQDLGS